MQRSKDKLFPRKEDKNQDELIPKMNYVEIKLVDLFFNACIYYSPILYFIFVCKD